MTQSGDHHSTADVGGPSGPRRGPSGWGLAILAWAIYTAGMAVAWLLGSHDYSDTHLLMGDIWWVILILAALMVLLVRWTGLHVQWSNRITPLSLLGIVPVALIIIGGMIPFVMGGRIQWGVVAVVFLGTLFVGIGEETAFRGLAFNAIAERTTVIWVVVASSVLFGLMHSVNVLVQSPQMTVVQVVMTTVAGIGFGWMYVYTGGNLWLMIVLHWLYDAFLIAPRATEFGANYFGSVPSLLFYLGAIVATVVGIIRFRGVRWSELAGQGGPAEFTADSDAQTA